MPTKLENSRIGFIRYGQQDFRYVLGLVIIYYAVGIATMQTRVVVVLSMLAYFPIGQTTAQVSNSAFGCKRQNAKGFERGTYKHEGPKILCLVDAFQ